MTAPDDLACDCPSAIPALALAVGVVAGAALTAGWLPVAIIRATRDSDARRWWADRPRR